MSREASVTVSVTITTLGYSKTKSFNADVAAVNGPTPGALTVSTHGTDVDLKQLTSFGGLCVITNLDTTNWVEYGIYDYSTRVFYPLHKLLPGEAYVCRLSDHIQKDEPGSGTGSFVGHTTWRFKAHQQSVIVVVEAFDP